MKLRIAFVLAVLMLAVFAPATSAVPQTNGRETATAPTGVQGSCPTSDVEKVIFWENRSTIVDDGNDRVWLCGASQTWMGNVPHEPSGNCASFPDSTTWDDCIDSVTIWLPNNRKFCIYTSPGYAGNFQCWTNAQAGIRWNLNSPMADSVSSYRFANN